MVWLTWILFYAAAGVFYANGVIVFSREPINFNIYILVFMAVLLAALFRGWQTRHKEFTALGLIFAANFTIGHLIWTYSGGYIPSVAGHGLLHAILAVSAIHFTKTRMGGIIALLFVLDAVWAFMAVTGMFPTRPWPTFTGFYYGDAIAYTGHLALIIFGLSCGDGGSRIKNWLNELRGRAIENHIGLGAGGDSLGISRGRRYTNIYGGAEGGIQVGRVSRNSSSIDRKNQ